VKRILLSTLVVSMLLAAAPWSAAQDATAGAEPMATISFSGYDALMADLDMIGKLGGNPKLAKSLEGILKARTQDQGLAGLDPKRPWGVALVPNQATVADGFAFLPVTDLDKLILVLRALGLSAEDAGNGVTKIEAPNGAPVFVKKKGDWAIVAINPAGLDAAPADPTILLGGTEKKYDLAVQLLLKNVPSAFKQMAVGQLSLGMERGMQRQPNESDEDYALRSKVTKQAVEQITAMIDDLDRIVVGISIDSEAKNAYVDFEATAKPGSKTAEQFALVKNAKTNFAGFTPPEAMATANWVGTLSKTDAARAKANIGSLRVKIAKELGNQGLSDAEVAKAKQLVDSLVDVILETVEAGQVDGGLAMLSEPNAATFVAGAAVADGAKLDKVLRDLAQTAVAESPDLAQAIKLDAATHEGIKLHTLSIPVPPGDNRDRIVEMVGENLDVVVGTGPKSVYLGAGRDAMAKLKTAIDQSKADAGKEVSPMRISVALPALAQFVAAVSDDERVQQQSGMVGMFLQQAGTDGHVTVTTRPVPNGVCQRLEFESGLLKTLGAMSQMATMMAPK
jgi:hypothetical protein